MSLCSNCHSEGTRIRTIWAEDGSHRDECPNCSPQSFEKFTAPSDRKIWMGYEAHPNEYTRGPDGGYDRKPEYRQEQEERLSRETDEERTLRVEAENRKRATRRKAEMDSAELAAALRKAEEISEWLVQSSDVN